METYRELICHQFYNNAPYSLGKLIEWKPFNGPLAKDIYDGNGAPYSLGKLIEWKRDFGLTLRMLASLPTR